MQVVTEQIINIQSHLNVVTSGFEPTKCGLPDIGYYGSFNLLYEGRISRYHVDCPLVLSFNDQGECCAFHFPFDREGLNSFAFDMVERAYQNYLNENVPRGIIVFTNELYGLPDSVLKVLVGQDIQIISVNPKYKSPSLCEQRIDFIMSEGNVSFWQRTLTHGDLFLGSIQIT